jgi:hypothetical protein
VNAGPCPYGCQGFLTVEVPAETPVFAKIRCPTCHQWVWYRLSRLDPVAYTTDGFTERYIVDEAARTITPRAPASDD